MAADLIIPICNFAFEMCAMGDKVYIMKKLSLILASLYFLSANSVIANERLLEEYVEARLFEIENKNNSALKSYKSLLKQHSNSQILADRLFELSLKTGDIEAALKAFDAREQDGALPVQAYILRYSAALKSKDWPRAIEAIEKIADDSVLGFMSPIMRAWIETAKSNDGTVFLKTSNNSGLTNYYARDQITYQLLYRKEYDKARKNIISVRPFNEGFTRDLILKTGPILYQNGHADFARALLNAQGSGAANTTLNILNNGKEDSAYLYEISPEIGIARLYGRVAETLVDQKIFDLSVFFARTAQWLAPNDRAVALYLGASLAASEQVDEANILLSKVKSTDPYFSLYAGQNIRILLDQDRNQEAVKIARQASELRPKSQSLLLLLAQTYDMISQYDEAAKAYEKLIKVTSDEQKRRQSYFSLYLARSQTKAGDWKKAVKTLEKGLEYKSNNPFLLNFYGYSLLERGEDYDRGFAMIKKAYDIEPTSPDITDSLGWGYYLKGDLKKALPLLERAAQISEDDPEIKEHLGDAYWSAGRRIDARYTWRIASLIAKGDDKKRLDHKAEFGLDVPYS